MLKLQVFLRLMCVWALLLTTQLASAHSPVHPETRVGAFEVTAETCARLSVLANSSTHQENGDASTAEAVGYPHATKGVKAPGVSGLSRTGSALKADPHHAFPNVVDNFATSGKTFSIPTRGPGGTVVRHSNLHQVEGSLNGKSGVFEWIVDAGSITHRRFIPGGKVTGLPNQVPGR